MKTGSVSPKPRLFISLGLFYCAKKSPVLQSAQEAAKYMNMPLGTLRQMVSKGKIKFYKPTGGKVYFRYSDLDAFMEGKKEEQQSNEMRGLI